MGGVVDIHEAREFDWKCVSGRVINCYCLTDNILRYVLPLAKFGHEPIGLNKISEEGSEKVEDFDLTNIVDGHLDYRDQMGKILDIIDLSNTNQTLKLLDRS